MMKNHAINRRNLQRRAHAEALLKPTSHLAQKVEAAKRLAYQTKAISNHDVYYTTAKTLLEQVFVWAVLRGNCLSYSND